MQASPQTRLPTEEPPVTTHQHIPSPTTTALYMQRYLQKVSTP